MSGQSISLRPQAHVTLKVTWLVRGAVLTQLSLLLSNCNPPAQVLRIHLVLTQQMCHGHISTPVFSHSSVTIQVLWFLFPQYVLFWCGIKVPFYELAKKLHFVQ